MVSLRILTRVSLFLPLAKGFLSPHVHEQPTLQRETTTTTSLHCQLLGMNSKSPQDFTCSFKRLARRGGDTDVHSHGWGLAFYEGRGLRCFHDPDAAASSPIAKFVTEYPIHTHNMIAHVRYATEGSVCVENVHPFQRELWGITFCFAHNGDVELFKGTKGKKVWLGGGIPGERSYNPIGDTDSEALFCAILNSLKARFNSLPSLPVLHDYVNTICKEIVSLDDSTILNFLLGCGQHVQFAYSWPGQRPGSKVWNGLHYTVKEVDSDHQTEHLEDRDFSLDIINESVSSDHVAMITTKPLTDDEEWIEMKRGELIMFDRGLPHAAPVDCFQAELAGHGLLSDCLPGPWLFDDIQRYAASGI
mmetsp:Transcript_38269/g.77973  ORF Transcript_38269/g.77973 Transcript_38269/m.77973 type:complete len:361 (-) Transcript_38269:127-1209(-)